MLVLTPGCLYTAVTTGATPEVASNRLAGMWGAAPQRRVPAGSGDWNVLRIPGKSPLRLTELSWLTIHTRNTAAAAARAC